MPISLKANSDGSAEILNGVISALKINTDGSLEGTTIDGKLDKSENIVLGTSVAASGTAVDFVGIPEGVKRITVMFDGVSTNGTNSPVLRIGSGNIESTNYLSFYVGFNATGGGGGDSPNGFILRGTTQATWALNGQVILTKDSLNTFLAVGGFRFDSSGTGSFVSGSKSLFAPLDRIRITTVNGTDQFDAGTINIAWEF